MNIPCHSTCTSTELARQHEGGRTPSGGTARHNMGTTSELSPDHRTTNSPDPQDGRAVFLGRASFKRAPAH